MNRLMFRRATAGAVLGCAAVVTAAVVPSVAMAAPATSHVTQQARNTFIAESQSLRGPGVVQARLQDPVQLRAVRRFDRLLAPDAMDAVGHCQGRRHRYLPAELVHAELRLGQVLLGADRCHVHQPGQGMFWQVGALVLDESDVPVHAWPASGTAGQQRPGQSVGLLRPGPGGQGKLPLNHPKR